MADDADKFSTLFMNTQRYINESEDGAMEIGFNDLKWFAPCVVRLWRALSEGQKGVMTKPVDTIDEKLMLVEDKLVSCIKKQEIDRMKTCHFSALDGEVEIIARVVEETIAYIKQREATGWDKIYWYVPFYFVNLEGGGIGVISKLAYTKVEND